MQQFEKDIINVIKASLNNEVPELSETFNFNLAYRISNRHQIVSLLFSALVKLPNFKTNPAYKLFEQSSYYLACVDAQQKFETDNLFLEFDKNDIDYMPIKGIIMKEYYPSTEMRVMSDVDVLIRVEDAKKISQIMKEKGFSYCYESNHEITYQKGDIKIEFHKYLIPTYNYDFDRYYGEPWKFGKEQVGRRYKMRPEDFYVYIFTHFAKHYRDKGVGIKHVVDFLVFLRAYPNLDWEYITNILSQLNLLTFYKNVEKLMGVWFENKEGDEVTDFLSNKIITGFICNGEETSSKSTALRFAKNSKNYRLKRFFYSIFPSYKTMSQGFPVLKKIKVLLPFFWGYRWVKLIITKPKKISKNLKEIACMPKMSKEYQEELNFVGLDYNF